MSGPAIAANGVRVVTLNLAIGYRGAAVADVELATGAALVSPVQLVVGNATRTMAVVTDPWTGQPRTRSFAGVTSARLVGGAGTWRTSVTLDPYDRPAGVMLSTVLSDLAMATGTTAATRERVRLAAGLDRSLGVRYAVEPGAPAGKLLALLAGPLWWVDEAGITQIAATRTAKAIKTPASVEHYDGGAGWTTVATEDLAAWVPGATYASKLVPDGVTVEAVRMAAGRDGKLRVEALVA